MKKILTFILCPLMLSACSTEKEITPEDLSNSLKSSGVLINDINDLTNESFPMKSFEHRFEFSIPEVAPKGGQAFICEEKKYCDAIYAYFDALKGLAGPYLYQSPNGKIILQLNSGLSVKTAKKLETAIQKYN